MIIVTLFSLWGVDLYNSLIDNPLENDYSFYTAVLICFRSTATHYCDTLLQHTTATQYCNTSLQHAVAATH